MRRLCPGRASAACCGVYAIARSPGLGRFGLVREWYQPHLERLYDYAPSRGGDLDQLEQIAMGYPNRERFLSEVTLDPPDATGAEAGRPGLDEDYLILSTIHSAKGQEWDASMCCISSMAASPRTWPPAIRRRSRKSAVCFMSP